MSPYLMPTLELGPLALERLVLAIPESRWDEKTAPDRFSLREAVAHLADWEPIFRERFSRIVAMPGTTISVYDESERAVSQNYSQQDVRTNLEKFIKERAKTASLLKSLPKATFGTLFEHPEKGSLVLEDLANMLTGHDLYHLEHLTQYLPRVA